jgi:Rha family phage regulatory protein
MNLALNKNAATMSSLEIAKLTGKQHNDVLKDIRRILAEVEIGEGGFSHTYLSSQNKQLPCFKLPRRECDLIIAGYSAKYRLAIIDRWQELENKEQIKLQDAQKRSELRIEFKPMTDALLNSREGKETKFFHYSNESDLINRIALGCTSSKYRQLHEIEKNESIRDYLTFGQKDCILALQRANTVYLLEGLSFEERKTRLINLYNRQYKDKLIAEQFRLEA